MSDTLKAGLTATRRVEIDRDSTISFMGDDCRVYSTPNLLYDIEMACRDLLLANIEAGKDSVGTRVELDHVGATLMGMKVELQVRIAEVQGRSVTFEVSGSDGIDAICTCRHQRFVVDVAKTEQRLAARALKAGLA